MRRHLAGRTALSLAAMVAIVLSSCSEQRDVTAPSTDVRATAQVGSSGCVEGADEDETCPIVIATDIGAQLGSSSSQALYVNNHGQVVGYWFAPGVGEVRAFIWERGVLTDLGTLGGSSTWPMALNERGQVVGSSATASGVEHAFLWENGVMTDLGTLGEGGSSAHAVNEQGVVVGMTYTENWEQHAFVWKQGVMTDLGGPALLYQAYVNESGVVTGFGHFPDDFVHTRAFRWQDGVMSLLENEGSSFAIGVNNRGQILGVSGEAVGDPYVTVWQGDSFTRLTAKPRAVPFDINERGIVLFDDEGVPSLWDGTRVTALPVPAGGTAVGSVLNEQGQVAGGINFADGTGGAALWHKGRIVNLGALGGVSSGVFDLNEAGLVVGSYTRVDDEGNEITRAVTWSVKWRSGPAGASEF